MSERQNGRIWQVKTGNNLVIDNYKSMVIRYVVKIRHNGTNCEVLHKLHCQYVVVKWIVAPSINFEIIVITFVLFRSTLI